MSTKSGSSDQPPIPPACIFLLIFVPILLVAYLVNEMFLKDKPLAYEPVGAGIPQQKKGRDQAGLDASGKAFAVCIIFGVISLASFVQAGSMTKARFYSTHYCAAGGCPVAYERYKDGKDAWLVVGSVALTITVVGAVAWVMEGSKPAPVVDVKSVSPTVYTIWPAAKSKFAPHVNKNLVASLAQKTPEVILQIVGAPDLISWRVVDLYSQYNQAAVITTIKTYWPDVEVEVRSGFPETTPQAAFYRAYVIFSASNEYVAPLPFIEDLKVDDPLVYLTQQMDFLDARYSERMTYSVFCGVQSTEAVRRAQRRLKNGDVRYGVGVGTERSVIPFGEGKEKPDPFVLAKLEQSHYHCLVAVTAESSYESRLQGLLDSANDVQKFQRAGYNGLEWEIKSTVYKVATLQQAKDTSAIAVLANLETLTGAAWRDCLLVLTPAEMAALWHLPDERFTAKSIPKSRSTIPKQLTGERGDRVVLGASVFPTPPIAVYLTQADRAYHHFMPGKTGMGKSTLMHNLIHQDIKAGRGLVLIDPHGALIDAVLGASVSPSDRDRIDLLDCGQVEYPVPINPFAIPPGVSTDAAYNSLYWVLRKLYERAWSETRMDIVVRNLIRVLLTDPQATPLDIQRFFNNSAYSSHLLAQLEAGDEDSPIVVTQFWQDFFGSTSDSEQRQVASPVLNRTGAFLGNAALSLMTCQPRTLPYQQMIREQRVVLVDLSGEKVKSEVDALGAMFMAGFYMAIQTLGSHQAQQPRFYMYVDEAEKFVTTTIPEILSQVRKFGLSMVIANQYLNQLPEKTLDGILGNVGTKTVFAISDHDAGQLGREFLPEVDRETMAKLSAYQVAVKTRYRGEGMPAFVIQTPPPPAIQDPFFNRDNYRVETEERYGFWSRQQIRNWQRERYRSPVVKPPASDKELPYYDS